MDPPTVLGVESPMAGASSMDGTSEEANEDLVDLTDLILEAEAETLSAEANELSAEATTSEDGANELSAEEVNWADKETQVEDLDEAWVDADDLVGLALTLVKCK